MQVLRNIETSMQQWLKTEDSQRAITYGALLLMIASLLPFTAQWFEVSMVRHMLVQMPLLAISGAWLLHRLLNKKAQLPSKVMAQVDPYGACALVMGTGWMLFWMLPLHLDLATFDPAFRLLKVISVPFGIGLCFYWAFSKSNLLVKLVICFEAWASISRLGWIFLESPEQLCSSYLIGEQQRVGALLLAASAVVAVTALFYGLFGSFRESHNQTQPP